MWKQIKKNNDGIALLLVLSSVTILSYVLVDFTFSTKLNKIRAFNRTEKLQAKLNAQAGLELTLAKLQVYRKIWNKIENNPELKKNLDQKAIEQAVTTLFIFPIPISKDLNLIHRTAIEKFHKDIKLPGELIVQSKLVSGFLNVNNLRINKPKPKTETEAEADEDQSDSTLHEATEKKIKTMLEQAIIKKREKDEEFDLLYGNIDPELLVKELKFYINNKDTFEEADKAQVDAAFLEQGLTPKHAPLSSLEELYSLPSWPDEIINLVKDQLSVHQVAIIPLNEINSKQLKVLFPNITEEQILEFFQYRDGSEELKLKPHPFRSEKDFKNYVIRDLGLVNNTGYDKMVDKLKSAGLRFGNAGKLFFVTSEGKYGRARYKISAYIDLPIKPPEKKKEPDSSTGDEISGNKKPKVLKPPREEEKDEGPEPILLLEPRVVEIKAG